MPPYCVDKNDKETKRFSYDSVATLTTFVNERKLRPVSSVQIKCFPEVFSTNHTERIKIDRSIAKIFILRFPLCYPSPFMSTMYE
ncbi:hypothetical protein EG68_03194 [Paragonimus skrjabini miyazakii]|uniref:Uncharacterized protein n=1 Tax=Paragonimus skrjabini miyazakii TaxID=59628 RepID=A0A8S9Z960_9TREM|nr:hypothetical protein EG68_03194 [Paragonimus skrjabini miyazakii]